jgi:hypothetical protein
VKEFVTECQKESQVFQESKILINNQLKKAARQTNRNYRKMKFKDEDQLIKDSKEFDVFQNQRVFKRQLISYLINKVDKADRARLVMRYKHKVQSENRDEKPEGYEKDEVDEI